jgi:carbon catabolite-derepressing protein kinase
VYLAGLAQFGAASPPPWNDLDGSSIRAAMNRPPTPGSPLTKPEAEETIQSIPEGSRASQLGPRRPEALSPGSQNTITSTGTDRSVRPYISKIGVLPSSLPAYHKAFMEARKAGKDTKLSPPQIDEHSGPHVQSTAEQAETARRLKPHSRSQLKLEEAKKPAGMTPVPAKKSRPTKWQFGIRSRNQPLEAIGCIYRALQKLGAEWVVDEDFRPRDRGGSDRYVNATEILQSALILIGIEMEVSLQMMATAAPYIIQIPWMIEKDPQATWVMALVIQCQITNFRQTLGYFESGGAKMECIRQVLYRQDPLTHPQLTFVGTP